MKGLIVLVAFVLAACGGPPFTSDDSASDCYDDLRDFEESNSDFNPPCSSAAECRGLEQVETNEAMDAADATLDAYLAQEDDNEVQSQNGKCSQGCMTHVAGCNIKGNIAFDTGEKIYHVPGGEFYDATTINPDYGERWFCTETDAKANGWRRSKQ